MCNDKDDGVLLSLVRFRCSEKINNKSIIIFERLLEETEWETGASENRGGA